MTAIQNIPLNKLFPSKDNVRKTAKTEGISSLAASIAAHGLRQNLNVNPTGDGKTYEVVAGGRRYAAMLMLVKQGKLADDAPVPCRLLTEGENAAEISLTENVMREQMHPDDECSTFCGLIEKQGMTIDDVAARFGVTPAVVKQRLKLAKVSPKLRGLFRKGEITLAQMMEFAISDDHKAQEHVWNEMSDWDRQHADSGDIKGALTEQAIHAQDKLVKFVGLDAYTTAGGSITRDLFGEEKDVFLTDRDTLMQLVQNKLDEEKLAVEAEGWKWVKVLTDSHVPYEISQHGRIKANASAKSKAEAGAVIYLERDGKLKIERGYIDAAVKKTKAKEAKAKAEGKTVEEVTSDYSAALIEDLTAHRTAALRVELAKRPDIALAMTVHALTMDLINDGPVDTCLGVRASGLSLERFAAGEDCSAHTGMTDIGTLWGDKLPGSNEDEYLDSAAVLKWCLAQKQPALLDLLAFLTALSVDAVVTKHKTTATESADNLARVLKLDMHKHCTPSAEGFYSRLSKAQMEAALKEAGVKLDISKDKKAEAAAKVHKALAGKAWLPEVLRFPS